MTATLLEMPSGNKLSHQPCQRLPGTWLQVLSHLDRKYGGLSAVVPALAAELRARQKVSTRLAAFCAPGENTGERAADVSIWPASHSQWVAQSALRRNFAQTVAGCDGVHIHGLWDASSVWAATAARQAKKPYLVSAHGMLEPWALEQKALKKRVYGALVERRTLDGAACLHALTTAEADDYRRFGCTRPIAVIPNAVEAPRTIDCDLVRSKFPAVAGKRIVLFLGRLHIKKGIELLLEAWASVQTDHPDAVLMLAGPGEESYVRSLRARAADLRIAEHVLFADMLQGDAKWSALQAAHVFVLPSYSEGLSVATLEALCAGTPVIVTDACHLPEVAEAECGWTIATAVQPLEQALHASLDATPDERQTMSGKARQLANHRFSWRTVSEQIAELYSCVLGGGIPQRSHYLGGAQ